MKYSGHLITLVLLAALFYLLFPRSVYAYLDLGSGSYFFQLILATLLGTSFAIKIYWKNIKTFLINCFSKKGKGKKK